MTEWFEEIFGVDLEAAVKRPPSVEIPEGEFIDIEFCEEKPRVVQTSVGRRALITVWFKDELRTLWLSRRRLAEEVGKLQLQYKSLKGLKVRIANLGKRGRRYEYQVKILEKPEGEE